MNLSSRLGHLLFELVAASGITGENTPTIS
jgi:hypothetical protein